MKMNRFFAIVIIIVWGALAIANAFVPKKDFLELENRTPQSWPTFNFDDLVNGEYTLAIDKYLADRIIWRDAWFEMKCKTELLAGKRENNGIYINNDMLIERTPLPNEKVVESNINGINHFASLFNGKIYTMIIPSAVAVEKNNLPSYPFFLPDERRVVVKPAWDQWSFLQQVNENFDVGISNIDTIALFKVLRGHYYRTDHHWNSEGAYNAYRLFADSADLPIRQKEEFVVETVADDFYGTLYSKSGYRDITPDEIVKYSIGEVVEYEMGLYRSGGQINANQVTNSIFFEDNLQKKDKYTYFLNDNYGFARIKTKSSSDKKLLIFKDSYANNFIPLLTEDYKEIMIVDLRHTSGNIRNIVDFDEYDDVLFLYSIELFIGQDVLGILSRLT